MRSHINTKKQNKIKGRQTFNNFCRVDDVRDGVSYVSRYANQILFSFHSWFLYNLLKMKRVSEWWLLFNAKWAIFQPYHGEN